MDYQTATAFLQLAVKALADVLIDSPLIDVVQSAYDGTNDDVGARNNNDKIAHVKEALEQEYGNLQDIIGGAFFGDSESRGTRGSNRSTSSQHPDTLVGKLIYLMQMKMLKKQGRADGAEFHVIVPQIFEKIPGKLLTVDLGVFFGDNPKLIPDPHPVVVKAGLNISKFFGTPLLAGCNGMREMEAASSFSGDHQGSIGSHHSEQEALTGEPGDAMMGEKYEEA